MARWKSTLGGELCRLHTVLSATIRRRPNGLCFVALCQIGEVSPTPTRLRRRETNENCGERA